MEQARIEAQQTYERPELKVLGTVQGLTHADKKYGPTDGNTFMGVPITNNSSSH
jgi:hypothetical protein